MKIYLYLPIIFVCLLVATFSSVTGQSLTYDTQILPAVPLGVTVNMSAIKKDFAPRLVHLESPSPDGDSYRSFLERQKKLIEARFPRKYGNPAAPGTSQRASGQPPILGRAFQGNFDNRGIPLDTHVGISNSGQVVSVINGDILVRDIDGNILYGISLDAFFTPLGLENANPFDPKIHYDPTEDKWIMVALGRYTNTQITRIYMAFSETNDATGNWNLYKLDGNPLVNNTWIDYPMVSISEHEMFLTGNSIRWNEPWETGFAQTMIFQIKKRKGYAGDPFNPRIWANLRFGPVKLRNMCPVKGGKGNYGPNHFFLSNRNFDMQNDSIFLVELTDTIGAQGANIRFSILNPNTKYGLPPNGQQAAGGYLATNDSRVLDGFYLNDQIQFVGNTIDTATGRASIYHGFIDNISGTKTISGYIISDDSLDLGYPSIAYTGTSDTTWQEEDAIIFFDTSSPDHPASTAAVYYDNQGNHSDIFRTRSGSGYINVLTDWERWGDYTGCQRKYDEPGAVWVMGTLSLASNQPTTWISEYFRPAPPASIKKPKPNIKLVAYPIPAREYLEVEFEIPKGESVEISLFSSQGQKVKTFFDDMPKSSGKARFSFSTTPLAAGVYMLRVSGDQGMLATKKVVITD